MDNILSQLISILGGLAGGLTSGSSKPKTTT
ncbi:VENN motif pre-toxin domain-containing protein [Rhodococcus sp. NPDC055112]|uniref:Pre-toxin domain with VENN motif-containing protein n=1 Tax=Rhodococcus maanshanensis TaxID=183556 RepID=A0A1H7PHM7_9NOCA|nr:VENN motif pre-toxin domain-containing protein [Rhodococcus maanshanensis]SEL34547.1 Pre-toxin domain with VENN motif-containing protein [Rhodococcus maanshanensis]